MELDPNDVTDDVKNMVLLASVRDTLRKRYQENVDLMVVAGWSKEAGRESDRAASQAFMRDDYLDRAFEKKELLFCTE